MNYATTYDASIQRHCAKRLPIWNWLRVKAQLIAESDLDPNAFSPRGAEGIAQFLPDTFADMRKLLGYPDDTTPFMADPAIDCCCAYMAHLYGQWRSHRTELDRWRLALASYNAGLGNLLEAQARSGGQIGFEGIMAYLPAVTGHDNYMQTREYVSRIERILTELLAVEATV